MTQFVALLWSTIKTVGILKTIFDQLMTVREKEILDSINAEHVSKDVKKTLLLSKITQAKTNEEKIVLFSAYNDVDNYDDSPAVVSINKISHTIGQEVPYFNRKPANRSM